MVKTTLYTQFQIGVAFLCAGIVAGCAAPASAPNTPHPAGNGVAHTESRPEQLRWLNRVTWGASPSAANGLAGLGIERFLDQQLRPAPQASMPSGVQEQIAAMTISQKPLDQLVFGLEQQRKEADANADDEKKKAAQQAYQQELNRVAREAATRSLLRDLYSPAQLQEQMTWFWMNHFNVHQNKSNIRSLIGDYEEHAIRAHALGRFRDLLGATVHHPAMLRYLDNEQNAAGHINENYARELMELHTLGVNGGYAQADVQELARILTGVGVNMNPDARPPNLKPPVQGHYVRSGLFEFNPSRHDYGDKVFLGRPVKGRGLAEVDEALDRLARHPSTARFISHKLAVYFVADDPPQPLVDRMARTFQASDGDIAATLRSMFKSPEFARSLGGKFKDPTQYVVSAVRLAYDDKPILNAGPMLNWLNRMGEPLYAHATPDGYSMTQSAWASSGQMATRFEIAKAIGTGNAGLFKSDGPQPQERAAFPQLANALYFQALQDTLGEATRKALDQANSPQEWNMYLLASPEFMNR
jgi:uncharacterized protein (DUF1800 family)